MGLFKGVGKTLADKEVKFSHDYDKRHRDIIPTVRSKDYMEEHNIKLGD